MATKEQVLGAAILFALYGIIILYFVIKGSRGTKNINDYAVGSFTFSPVFVALSLAAAMTSAATFVINPGLVATYGVSGYFSFGIVFPIASLTSLVILTKSFRKFGQSVNALSLSSWIGKKYDSKSYALFVAFLTVLLIAFVVLILVALTKVISQALNANQILVLAIIIAFTFGYMMFGGANSMVYTNVIQASIMVLVALILIGSGIQFLKDGVGGFFEKLGAIDPNLVAVTNTKSPLFRDFFEIILAQIIVGAAVVCQPHIITKSLLLKKENDVNKFLVVTVIVQMLFFTVVVAGLFARLKFPDLMQNGKALNVDSIIPAYVISVFSGGFGALLVGLLVILGLISAGFSTIEGLIQSLSTTITTDIIKPLFGRNITNEKKYVNINRIVIIVLAIVSFFVARDQILHPKLSVAIFAQNGVYAYFSILFVPIIFGIFLKGVKIKAALSGSLTALVVYYTVYYVFPAMMKTGTDFGHFNLYFADKVQNPAIAAAIAIILSLIVGFIVHLTNKKQTESVQQ
ncbi:Na+/panthothenate symporter [uncultured Paludibacter sp.]|nr:Na+/panthothenate symporter [uncultured Paludibacter sp.]